MVHAATTKHMVRTEMMQGVCVVPRQQFSEDLDEGFWSPIIDSHGSRSHVWALMLTAEATTKWIRYREIVALILS